MLPEQFKLAGKVAVITGGAGFMGIKHAETILEAGGTPVLADINEELVDAKVRELEKRYEKQVVGAPLDITDKKGVTELLCDLSRRFGNVGILINNAANDPKVKDDPEDKPWSRFENLPEEVWDKDMAVGLKGAFICSQVFGTHMAENGKGVILNIASDLGIIAPDQRIYKKEGREDAMQPVKPVTYSVLKHGIIGLTKYLATYWAEKGVRVNAFCPGGIYNNQPGEFVKKLTSLIPMGRMANIDEYKAAVLFLVSDASSYMTGANLVVDGGRTCW